MSSTSVAAGVRCVCYAVPWQLLWSERCSQMPCRGSGNAVDLVALPMCYALLPHGRRAPCAVLCGAVAARPACAAAVGRSNEGSNQLRSPLRRLVWAGRAGAASSSVRHCGSCLCCGASACLSRSNEGGCLRRGATACLSRSSEGGGQLHTHCGGAAVLPLAAPFALERSSCHSTTRRCRCASTLRLALAACSLQWPLSYVAGSL